MSLCDICNTPVEGTIISAAQMRQAVASGFNPFAAINVDPSRVTSWRDLVQSDSTDWNLCDTCLREVRPYFAGSQQAIPQRPISAPGLQNSVVLAGHEERLMDAAISPDGSRVLTCGWDSTIRIWDSSSGRELACLREHRGFVSAVTISPDGSTAASAGADRIIRLWDLERQKKTHTLSGHSFTIFDLAFSPDGSMLLSGSGDSTVRLWDPRSGKQIRKFGGFFAPKHSSGIQSVSFSPDQSLALSVGLDAFLWDVNTGKQLRVFPRKPLWFGAILRDGRSAILSGPQGFSIFDLNTGSEIETLSQMRAGSGKFSLTRDDRLFFGYTPAVTLYDLNSRRTIFTADAHDRDVKATAITSDGRLGVSASDDRTARTWQFT